MQIKTSRFTKAALIGVLSATAAFGASDTLYDYYITAVDATAGYLPNKLALSVYEEVRFEDNQHNSPRRDREENLALKTGVNAALTRTKGWATYGIDADASYQFWRRDAHEKNAFDWNISPMLLLSVDSENNLLQNLKLSFSSKSKYEKLAKTDRREARHVDNRFALAYDFMCKSRFGNVLTFDYEYDYYTKNKYKNRSFELWEIGMAPYYKFSAKVKGGLRLAYREKDYRDHKSDRKVNHDSSKKTVAFYVNYDPTLKLNIYSEAGFSRTDYEGAAKEAWGDGDWKPTLKLRVRYMPNANWTAGYGCSLDFDDTEVSGKWGGSYQLDNFVFLIWKPSRKFNLSNTLGIDYQNEKDECKYDTTEYYYNLRASYYITPKFSCYALYNYSNVNYQYKGRDTYFSNDVTLGVKYTF